MGRGVALLTLAAGLNSCGLEYLGQAARGQAELLGRARPVAQALADPALPAEQRRKLALAVRVRRFAVEELGLPDTRAFLTYSALPRPYVVWTVSSAPEFGSELRRSCFPVVGCVTYQGFFSEQAAQAEAARRRAAGEDVSVGGVQAYSTLGYLPDPLTSPMLNNPDTVLIRLVIHELAHAGLYVAGDTAFSESYAALVEQEGTRRYLERFGTPALRAEDRELGERREAAGRLAAQARADLARLYARPLPPAEKRAAKAARLAELRAAGAALPGSVTGGPPFAAANNATLGAMAAYTALVPEFAGLLRRLGGDLRALREVAAGCGHQPAPRRLACLRGDNAALSQGIQFPGTLSSAGSELPGLAGAAAR